jgi:hypothetical protein
MAIQASDLISPNGEIDSSLFPGDADHELNDRLEAYILEAQGKVPGASDEAIQAWAYHRSYRAVFIRLSSEPAVQSLNDQGSVQVSKDQIQNFNLLADQYLAKWLELTQETSNIDASSGLGPSGSVSNKFGW